MFNLFRQVLIRADRSVGTQTAITESVCIQFDSINSNRSTDKFNVQCTFYARVYTTA